MCPIMQQVHGLDSAPGVVSVNHALIASWVKIEQAGGRTPGNVLADDVADLVFDEAHALEDSLTSAWTESVDAHELDILVSALSPRSRLLRALRSRAKGDAAFEEATQSIAVATTGVADAGRVLAQAVHTYLHEYSGKADAVVLSAGIVTSRPEFRSLRQAASDARYGLIQLAKAVSALRNSLSDVRGSGSEQRRLRGYAERLSTAIELLATLNDLPDNHLWVYRLATEEDDSAAWVYERIPIHVFPKFQQSVVDHTHSTVLCSATLTVQHRFDYLASRLGISIDADPKDGQFRGLTLRSPFDYARQSVVVLTNHLPIPIPENEREFCEEMAADQAGFLSLSGGRTLSLFAARKRMEAVVEGGCAVEQSNSRNAESRSSSKTSKVALKSNTGSAPNLAPPFTD
jgi:ATP-dependent DNA helicase RecQ